MLPGTTSWCKPFTFCLYHTHVAGTKVICFSASVIYWNQTKSTVLLSPVSFPCFSFMGFFFWCYNIWGVGRRVGIKDAHLHSSNISAEKNGQGFFWQFTCSYLEIPFVFPFPLPWFQLFSCTLIFSLLKEQQWVSWSSTTQGLGSLEPGNLWKKSNYES